MSAGIVISTFRSLPLQQRADLECASLGDEEDAGWVVKDPLSLEYHQLESAHFAVLSKLNGRVTMQELLDEIQRRFPTQHWTLAELQKLIIDLHSKGLIVSDRPGQADTLRKRRTKRRWQQLKGLFGQLLFARLPGWNPCQTLDGMLPWVTWIYHPAVITAAAMLVAASWLLILVEFSEFRSRLPEFQQFFGWSNLPLLWGTLAVTKVLHEFGHGLTCHYYGRRCHQMGVMLLLFTPTLYCDATDSWMLRDRWQRIWIGAGGMLFEIVLSAIATFIWWWTQPGLIHNLALNIVFVSAVTTVVFNANPLLRYDGYYILSDWLGIPNLRMKADRLLDRKLASWACGHQVLDDPLLPQRNEGWFVLYALAATAYGWFVMGGILTFLYSWLKPHQLQSIGIGFAVLSGAGVLMSLGIRAWRIGRGARHGSVHWWRVAVTWLALVAGLCGLLWVPIPWYVEAAVIVEPTGAAQILNPVPGCLKAVHVKPGDIVAAGDQLLELENSELEDRLLELENERMTQTVAVAAAQARSDVAEHAVAVQRLKGLEERIAAACDQLRQLTICAPAAGMIVAPEHKSPPPELGMHALPSWDATPLDPKNLGCWLEARTSLASIAPGGGLTATLYLPQAHRDEVASGAAVSLKFDALPDRTFRGRLLSVSSEHADVVPLALSNKAGGQLATVTLPTQQEQLQELAYRADVLVEDKEQVLRTGLRGSARFVISRHTAGWWLLQTFHRTFRFRM